LDRKHRLIALEQLAQSMRGKVERIASGIALEVGPEQVHGCDCIEPVPGGQQRFQQLQRFARRFPRDLQRDIVQFDRQGA
jgi:hypothetical protein